MADSNLAYCRDASDAPPIGTFDKSRWSADLELRSRGPLNAVNDVSDPNGCVSMAAFVTAE